MKDLQPYDPAEIIMKLYITVILLSICALSDAASARTAQPLFYIERALNANIVRYDAQVETNGTLSQREPVIAYWVLNAEDGRRESLNYVQKIKAYGIKVKPNAAQGEYLLIIVSFKERPIRVFMNNGVARAEMDINGSPAFLEKVFIQTTGAFSRPDFIEFYGKDAANGEETVERVNTD